MKTLNIQLTDEEHAQAEQAKNGKSWREAFLERFEVTE